MSKLVVLGAPLTGKSTLAKTLRTTTSIPVLDFDEELMKLNNGKYPANYAELNVRLKKEVIKNISAMDEVIFFAFEIEAETLLTMKQNGFRIAQLAASLEILETRNQDRLNKDPSNNAFQYIEKNLQYQNKIKELGLVDITIDTGSLSLGMTLEEITQLSKDAV